jgi:FAD/FMN-containing dehydrogenase
VIVYPSEAFAHVDAASIARLNAEVDGDVLVPADHAYAEAVASFNRSISHRPAAVIMAHHGRDVAAAVRWARERGLGIGVQATGHGITSACDGLLINTSRMREVVIDPERRTVRAGAGARWSDVIPVASWFGLAPLSGTSPGVGVVGYTLGGGIGWMARRYGFACDSVIAIELVTADGELIRASNDDHRDLFWAVRGGAGNFGVVTGIEFTLYPERDLFGGALYFPLDRARELLEIYAGWTAGVPDTMTSRVVIVHAPDAPFVPPPLRGRWLVSLQGAFLGSDEDGAALLAPFAALGPSLVNTFGRMPFTSIGSIANEPAQPMPTVMRTALVGALTPATIEAVVGSVGRPDQRAVAVVDIRHLGGALAAGAATTSAAGRHDAQYWVTVVGVAPEASRLGAAEAEVDAVDAAIAPHATGWVFVNGLNGPGATRRTRFAWTPAQYRRLQAVKHRYDPENVFRFNRNVPPSLAAAVDGV